MQANCVHFTHYVCSVYIVHFAINPLSSKWKPWVEPSGSSGHPAFHARDHQLSSPYHQVNHRHHHDQDHLQVNHCHLQNLDHHKSIIIILKIIMATVIIWSVGEEETVLSHYCLQFDYYTTMHDAWGLRYTHKQGIAKL